MYICIQMATRRQPWSADGNKVWHCKHNLSMSNSCLPSTVTWQWVTGVCLVLSLSTDPVRPPTPPFFLSARRQTGLSIIIISIISSSISGIITTIMISITITIISSSSSSMMIIHIYIYIHICIYIYIYIYIYTYTCIALYTFRYHGGLCQGLAGEMGSVGRGNCWCLLSLSLSL